MADIGVKMGVTGIAQFKTAMQQGTQSVKTLDAALKMQEKQLELTGNKEQFMQQRTKTLTDQIKAQQTVIKNAEQALKSLENSGVKPTDEAYKKMQKTLLEAQTAMLGMQVDLQNVGAKADQVTQKADKMSGALNNINKTVSFEAVLTGIGKITDGMESAARKIASIARDMYSTMADAATWADDEKTLASIYGIDVEKLQKMQKVAENEVQTPVEAIIRSQQKLKNVLTYGSKDVEEAFVKLGLGGYSTKYDNRFIIQQFDSIEDAYWAVGEALKDYGDEIERDAMAQKIFGRSWMELRPMFDVGREAYESAVESQTAVSAENVDKLEELSKALKDLRQDFQTTEYTILSELAPALTLAAEGLSDVLGKVNEYLQTEEGQEKLQALGDAVTRLFENITNIDTGEIIDKVSGALDSVTKSLEWIWENKEDIVNAIKAIAGAFIALKAVEVAGTFAISVNAMKNLVFGSGGNDGTTGGLNTSTTAMPTGTIDRIFAIGALSSIGMGYAETTGQGLYGEMYRKQHPEKFADYTLYDTPEGLLTSKQWQERHPGEEIQFKMPETTTPTMSGMSEMVAGLVEALQKDIEEERNNIPDLTYGDPYNLPGSTTPKEEMQASWDAIVSALNKSEAEITAEGEGVADALEENALLVATSGTDLTDVILELASKIAAIKIPTLTFSTRDPNLPGGEWSWAGSHANGLPWVPYDNYPALLHYGERVVPANQNRSYTANSYVNVQSMYMNSGNDVHALAEAIAAENTRMQQGFGS